MERTWCQAQHEPQQQQSMDAEDERSRHHQDKEPALGSKLRSSAFITSNTDQDEYVGGAQIEPGGNTGGRTGGWTSLRDEEKRNREATSSNPSERIRHERDRSMQSFDASQSPTTTNSSRYDEQSERRPRDRERSADVEAIDMGAGGNEAAPFGANTSFRGRQDSQQASRQWMHPRGSISSDDSSWSGSPRLDQTTSSPLEENRPAPQPSYQPANSHPLHLGPDDRYTAFINQSTRFRPERTSSQIPAGFGMIEKLTGDTDVNAAAVSGPSAGRRHSRECKIDGCPNYIINQGVCFRHGGGRKCSEEGCTSSAKSTGRCWKHGGSVKCLVESCTRKGKSRGVCWAHGGGTMCTSPSCEKVAISNGFCWAHGGGKRCMFEGCNKAASKRTLDYCATHYALLKDGNVTLEV